MVITVEHANISFDLNWAKRQLDHFNSNLFWIAADRMAWNLFHKPCRTWAQWLVVGVDSLMRTRVPDADRITLSEDIREMWQCVRRMANTIGRHDLRENPQAVFDRVKPLFESLLTGQGNGRRHYSFASKFLHWASNGRLPIVDDLARKSIQSRQRAFRQANPTWVNETRVLRDPRRDRADDYKRLLFFYSDILRGLKEHGKEESLLKRDRQKQSHTAQRRKEFIIKTNTLVRVLDKVFWIDGQA